MNVMAPVGWDAGHAVISSLDILMVVFRLARTASRTALKRVRRKSIIFFKLLRCGICLQHCNKQINKEVSFLIFFLYYFIGFFFVFVFLIVYPALKLRECQLKLFQILTKVWKTPMRILAH